MRDLHAHGHALALFGLDLLAEHLVEKIQIRRFTLGRLIQNRVHAFGNEAQAEALQMLDDARMHNGTHRAPPTTASYSASERPNADKALSTGSSGVVTRHRPARWAGSTTRAKGSRLRACEATSAVP